MAKSGKDSNAWYVIILRMLKLETTTKSGRINLGGVLILAAFCILYTTQDVIRHAISAAEDTVKSIALGQEIYHPYESNSVVQAVLPIFVGFVLCLIYLYIDDRKRNKMKDEIDNNKEIDNPLEKI